MNKKTRNSTLYLTQAGVIAAAYVALTYLSSSFGLAYGEIQFRISEALTILPAFTPAAIPGLVAGCLISNIVSPMGIYDLVFGTLATLLAALLTRLLRNICIKGLPLLSLVPPVLCNAVIVGLEITFLFSDEAASLTGFTLAALSVGAGELAVCLLLGLPLAAIAKKTRVFERS